MREVIAVVLVGLGSGCAQPLERDPAKAEIVTADLPRFWQAFDEGIDGDLGAALERRYFGPASPSLRAFQQKRIGDTSRMVETVTRNRRYFESIRANTLAFSGSTAFAEAMRAVFVKAKALDPEAVFPPTALLIGRMNSGGTTSTEGILIGLELFTRAPDSPLDTLDDFERNAVTTSELLVPLVAHEHVHVLQAVYGAPNATTLLEQSVSEGIADFVGEQTSGALLTSEAYVYGPAHEAALWAEFKAEMDGTDLSRWLYNRGKLADRPGDLGYFIGYRIAQAWAKQHGDIASAVRQLVRVKDARRLLEESGYDGVVP